MAIAYGTSEADRFLMAFFSKILTLQANHSCLHEIFYELGHELHEISRLKAKLVFKRRLIAESGD